MNELLYFFVKYYPIWGILLILLLFPITYNLFKAKKYLIALIFGIFISFIVFLGYLYFEYDGYNKGYKIVKEIVYN